MLQNIVKLACRRLPDPARLLNLIENCSFPQSNLLIGDLKYTTIEKLRSETIGTLFLFFARLYYLDYPA
jgi:hypothetical protein